MTIKRENTKDKEEGREKERREIDMKRKKL